MLNLFEDVGYSAIFYAVLFHHCFHSDKLIMCGKRIKTLFSKNDLYKVRTKDIRCLKLTIGYGILKSKRTRKDLVKDNPPNCQ